MTQKVGGSSPLSHPIQNPCNQTQASAGESTSGNATNCRENSTDCNEAQERHLTSTFSRQVTAKEFEPAALPAELAGVVAAWPALPEHIKAAVLALVRAVQ